MENSASLSAGRGFKKNEVLRLALNGVMSVSIHSWVPYIQNSCIFAGIGAVFVIEGEN